MTLFICSCIVSVDVFRGVYSRSVSSSCVMHTGMGNYLFLSDFMTACAPFPWGNQAAVSSWAYAVLLCCLCRTLHFFIWESFYKVIAWAGTHQGVWDVRFSLLSPTKVCNFKVVEYLPVREREETQGSMSAEGQNNPESPYTGAKEKGNAIQECQGMVVLFLVTNLWNRHRNEALSQAELTHLSHHYCLVLFDSLIKSLSLLGSEFIALVFSTSSISCKSAQNQIPGKSLL